VDLSSDVIGLIGALPPISFVLGGLQAAYDYQLPDENGEPFRPMTPAPTVDEAALDDFDKNRG
jgi:hypothetical protein